MTTLCRIGGIYINLAAVYSIDPQYDASKWDKKASAEPGVEVLMADGVRHCYFGAVAGRLRAFLAGEGDWPHRYKLGSGAEVLDFDRTWPATEAAIVTPFVVMPPDEITADRT